MAKLPDDETLKKFLYVDGLTDRQIAAAYGVSIQAVNKRYVKMGIQRKPWMNTATAILDAAWPSTKDFKRSEYTGRWRARELFAFLRWRLGDPTLSAYQLQTAENFSNYARSNDVVLDFDPDRETPWMWQPRTLADENLILRWPKGRELPTGEHLKALTLPDIEP
ncbi:hypothetical protein NHG22_11335 [Streptomyces sp. ATE26]|uniref:hypothetical protein n=1 Tax=Streptomyces sp. ATE26 TaxID=2954237 RepID=UPI002483078F|nr:hypothetical protein [Streptomyces sp. ATE26]MDI1454397.1 hypothetical protein [Streptomyces sp. ATE26]